jgi:hypothetical protein
VKSRFQNLPFKCNLQRYNEAAQATLNEERRKDEAGLYKLRIHLTHGLKAPDFNP